MDGNKIIAFANMKGGSGKTTLCTAFASYLTAARMPVVVVDSDLQGSITSDREDDKNTFGDTPEPWQIIPLDTTFSSDKEKRVVEKNIQSTLEKLKQLPLTVLIDCPGDSDVTLRYIYNAADVIVIPFEMTRKSLSATIAFAKMLKEMEDNGLSNAELYFIPNRFVEREKNLDREQVKHILKEYGILGTRVNERTDVKRINTYAFPAKLRGIFRYAFEALTEFIYGKKVIL